MSYFKAFGVIGLILITIGVLNESKKKESLLFIFGGLLLEVYSIYLEDFVFITLQIVFIISACYEYWEHRNEK
jgi:lipid-A-disaccharide synthase-like uncharacterized protein